MLAYLGEKVSISILGRVRVWIGNQGTRAVKVISRDCSLASDLVKAQLLLLIVETSGYDAAVNFKFNNQNAQMRHLINCQTCNFYGIWIA